MVAEVLGKKEAGEKTFSKWEVEVVSWISQLAWELLHQVFADAKSAEMLEGAVASF